MTPGEDRAWCSRFPRVDFLECCLKMKIEVTVRDFEFRVGRDAPNTGLPALKLKLCPTSAASGFSVKSAKFKCCKQDIREIGEMIDIPKQSLEK